jgi:hypothetical protein
VSGDARRTVRCKSLRDCVGVPRKLKMYRPRDAFVYFTSYSSNEIFSVLLGCDTV